MTTPSDSCNWTGAPTSLARWAGRHPYVTLSYQDCLHAVSVAQARRADSKTKRLTGHNRRESADDDGLLISDIKGAYGEVGFARYLQRPLPQPQELGRYRDPDVAWYGVRAVMEASYKLILQEKDTRDRPYVSVLVYVPFIVFRGWLWGYEIEQPAYLYRKPGWAPCWMAPATVLHPMTTLPTRHDR